ncbi:MAG: hypothetical protein FD123_1443 [Bacteroidetes bacterium]|nr:MAG: hypothetical protein FD123_1443 [Bacteroidota bacterium]
MKNPTFRRRVFRVSLWLMTGYLLLFGFRLLYSYSSKSRETESSYISSFFDDFTPSRKNYASEKTYRGKTETTTTAKDDAGGSVQHSSSPGIKYEKTATIKSRSAKFTEDEQRLRSDVTRFRGIIQYEENTGQAGDRELHLMIGVPPEKFDSCYQALKKNGRVRTADITKVDKTSEYKDLNARRASLEQTRASLIEFKKQNGRIEEFMMLQNRILEIEEKLQALGVQLGDFAEENEFCTIRFSLVEGNGPAPISLLHRLKVCFEWTTQYYLALVGGIALTVAAAFFGLLVFGKVRELIKSYTGRKKEEPAA